MKKPKYIIITDLDGTLLDHNTYSFKEAEPAIKKIKKTKTPLIFCSSKTEPEILSLSNEIGIKDPFIFENGGGISISKDFYLFNNDNHTIPSGKRKIIPLGTSYEKLIKMFNKLRKGYDVIGFSDMTISEITKKTDLSTKKAEQANYRKFTEPFYFKSRVNIFFLKKICTAGLGWTKGGRFYHIYGGHDKGSAVCLLIKQYRRIFPTIESIGIGDSENDFSFLSKVDHPFAVLQKNLTFCSLLKKIKKIRLIEKVGPSGWNSIVNEILKTR